MTGLTDGIINPEASFGITAQNTETAIARRGEILAGQAPPEVQDKDNIAYFGLDPDSLTDQVCMPLSTLGVSIAEVTVRASGERFVL